MSDDQTILDRNDLRALHDDVLSVCMRPAIVPPVPQVFGYTAQQIEQPMIFGVMR